MSDTPFYKLPLTPEGERRSGDQARQIMHPSYHTGGTVTGRFAKPPETKGLEALGHREGRSSMFTAPARSVLTQMDYAKIEERVMAQMYESMGAKRIDHETFEVSSVENFEQIGELVKTLWASSFAEWYCEFAVNYFFNEIDEEGCGAVFAAIKTWED